MIWPVHAVVSVCCSRQITKQVIRQTSEWKRMAKRNDRATEQKTKYSSENKFNDIFFYSSSAFLFRVLLSVFFFCFSFFSDFFSWLIGIDEKNDYKQLNAYNSFLYFEEIHNIRGPCCWVAWARSFQRQHRM